MAAPGGVCQAVALMDGRRLAGVFYCVQFERVPLAAVDRIWRLTAERAFGVTPRELAQEIDEALSSQQPLKPLDAPGSEHSEAALRDFLVALRARLPDA